MIWDQVHRETLVAREIAEDSHAGRMQATQAQ